ncbi:MAG: hypothetical protein KPEEDBHJ_01588 [Anaerolineales bacterium]|nr:hypothetical protein [Anaerolineales bacterium]
MNFLKKLFASRAPYRKNYYAFAVTCKRCGETIEGRIDLDNDPSVDYEQGGEVFRVRKVLMGANQCFQRVEANFKFDADRRIIEKDIVGGEFVE